MKIDKPTTYNIKPRADLVTVVHLDDDTTNAERISEHGVISPANANPRNAECEVIAVGDGKMMLGEGSCTEDLIPGMRVLVELKAETLNTNMAGAVPKMEPVGAHVYKDKQGRSVVLLSQRAIIAILEPEEEGK